MALGSAALGPEGGPTTHLPEGGIVVTKSRLALAAACAATLALAPAAAAHGGGGSPRDPDAKRFVRAVSVDEDGQAPARPADDRDASTATRARCSRRAIRRRSTTSSSTLERLRLQPAGQPVQLSGLGGDAAARAQPGLADAGKVYVPGDEEDNDLPTRRLHHDGELAHGRADERPGVPGRRHRRPADGRLRSRLRRGRLRRRLRQGRARAARHVRVRRQVGSSPRPPAPRA